MDLKTLARTSAIAAASGVALLGMTVPSANAVTNYVKNISNGYYIFVDDSCRTPYNMGPGQTINLKCGSRRFKIPATDCVTLNRVGYAPHTYCAGSRDAWQSFNWAPGTTTLKRTN